MPDIPPCVLHKFFYLGYFTFEVPEQPRVGAYRSPHVTFSDLWLVEEARTKQDKDVQV